MAIAEAAKEAAPGEGLYRCVFPEGVTGELAAFKDGSGLLGTIMNEEGIVGQARWIPAEGKSIALAINPVTLAIAVAMMNIVVNVMIIWKISMKLIERNNYFKKKIN